MPVASLKRILYVEDEADIRIVAQLALESLGGFTLEVCNDGFEAVEKGQLVFGEEGSRAADDGAKAGEVVPADVFVRNLQEPCDHRGNEMNRGHLVPVYQLEKMDRVEARLD